MQVQIERCELIRILLKHLLLLKKANEMAGKLLCVHSNVNKIYGFVVLG
jgi:hypothetical protein